MRFLKVMATSTVAVSLLFGASSPGVAQTEYDQNIDYLVTSVGVPADDVNVRAEVVAGLEEAAQERGISREEVARQAVAEYKSYDTTAPEHRSSRNTVPQTEVAANSGKQVAMGKARYVGDVFYSSNSTVGIQHGHNGIYYEFDKYVEAAGFGRGVVTTHATSKTAPAPAYKYYVGWDKQSPNKIKAANFALGKVGKPYNGIFFQIKR